MSEDCVVCTEPLDGSREIACGHPVHLRCIAESGQQHCPVCRGPVHFSQELHSIYERRRDEHETERRNQQSQESLELARRLRDEDEDDDDDEPPRYRDRRRWRPMNDGSGRLWRPSQAAHHGGRAQIRVRVQDGALDQGDMILQLNQLMMDINDLTRTTPIEADARIVRLYEMVVSLNTIAAETGLTLGQICDVVSSTS